MTLKNLELCYPELDAVRRRQLARGSLRHYARNALEIGLTWYGSRRRIERLFLPPAGYHHFQAARASGAGVVLLTLHWGSWEMLGLKITPEIDGAILYKPGEGGAVEQELIRRRGRFGARLVPAGRAGLRTLVESLRGGRAVILLPDQEPTDGAGRFAPLFGVPALTGLLVPRLLQKTGARVLFMVCERRPGGRYRVHWLPAENEIHSPDNDRALAALNRGVERCIAIDPAQYLWGYKRFRARPDGAPRFY